ncbi:acyltransferase family protein [Patescibacteria group bacterium]
MRYALIDVIRTIAIIFLLTGHIAAQLGNYLAITFIYIGDIYAAGIHQFAVTIFIILSGIVLGIKYQDIKISFMKFMGRRLIRIYSVYLIAVIVGVGMYYILHGSFSNIPGSHFICTISGFCGYIGQGGGPFVSTGWFIGTILALYTLFPVILLLMKKNKHLTLFLLLLVSLIARLYFSQALISPIYELEWHPFSRIFEFGLGIYLALIISKERWRILNRHQQTGRVFNFLAQISFPLFLIHGSFYFVLHNLTDSGVPAIFAIALYLLICLLVSWAMLKISIKLRKTSESGHANRQELT